MGILPPFGGFFHDLEGPRDYTRPRESALPYLLGLAMLATLVVLVVGVASFGVSGDFYLRHANNLMRLRVVMPGLAVAVLALIVYLGVA